MSLNFGLALQNLLKYYTRIDHYWRQIGRLKDDKRTLKYTQLFALVKCVLSVSHANRNLQKVFSKKNVDRELTQQALSKIDISTERKIKFENDLDILGKKN